ncbi:MAG: hypothetical protein AAGH99_01705 [Planctomycetota bacterium]
MSHLGKYLLLVAIMAFVTAANSQEVTIKVTPDNSVHVTQGFDTEKVSTAGVPVESTDNAQMTILFPEQKPEVYELESEEDYYFITDGYMLAGGYIELTAVFDGTGETIDEFTHVIRGGDWLIEAEYLATLPLGEVIIIATLKTPGRPDAIASHPFFIIEAAELTGPETFPVSLQDAPELLPGQVGEDDEDWLTIPEYVDNEEAPDNNRVAIARWDVVPEQIFEGQFAAGVVAHHIYGIDYVEFQVEGGEPIRVNEPSINPRTTVEEYWIVLDSANFSDGRIQVRATAYPNNGVPRALPPLFLYSNENGTVRHQVIELPAGRHTLDVTGLPLQGWLTVRPKPGVRPEWCVVVGRSRGWQDGNLKLENLTYEPGPGNGPLTGFNHDNQLWMDGVRVIGSGEVNPTNWITQAWTHQYYTDCNFSRVRRVFHHGPVMARNITAVDIYEDFANANGLYANISVDRLDRRSITSAHPDLFQFPRNAPDNLIIQDLIARNNNGQGLFTDDMKNVAVVRMRVDTIDPFRAIQLQGKSENVLIENSVFNGAGNFRIDKGFSANDLVFRNSRAGGGPQFLPVNWNTPGVRVLPTPGGNQASAGR